MSSGTLTGKFIDQNREIIIEKLSNKNYIKSLEGSKQTTLYYCIENKYLGNLRNNSSNEGFPCYKFSIKLMDGGTIEIENFENPIKRGLGEIVLNQTVLNFNKEKIKLSALKRKS